MTKIRYCAAGLLLLLPGSFLFLPLLWFWRSINRRAHPRL